MKLHGHFPCCLQKFEDYCLILGCPAWFSWIWQLPGVRNYSTVEKFKRGNYKFIVIGHRKYSSEEITVLMYQNEFLNGLNLPIQYELLLLSPLADVTALKNERGTKNLFR